jgi:hypothetical protein
MTFEQCNTNSAFLIKNTFIQMRYVDGQSVSAQKTALGVDKALSDHLRDRRLSSTYFLY